MWGCLIAAAITFPLVFGWVYFATVPDRLDHYRVYVFDYPTITFPVDSLFAFMVFHGLVWSSLMVVAGVLLALHRRLRDEGAAALQQFHDDMLPLLLLFAVAATGLMLTASYTWLKGYAYDFLAILHAVAVIITLLWLPFGKLFHVFQRSAQVGVLVYREAGRLGDQARCRRCQEEFASQMHVDDLIEVERQLGYRYEVDHPDCDHYQRICPRCRRLLLALAQGARWQLFPQPRREEHREAAVGGAARRIFGSRFLFPPAALISVFLVLWLSAGINRLALNSRLSSPSPLNLLAVLLRLT
ncbi:MAG: hypothetical protein KatS3mg105_3705 [Gemmatales bacterium]|nr:MAG: hypothetical protein KatS3mg105_3705 [Gemmatales bacterium]